MTDTPNTALVEFEVRDTTPLQTWLNTWAERAADARDGEPGTLAYEALVNVEAPSHVLVYERYRDADAISAHTARPSHQVLTETMGAARMTRRRVLSARCDDIDGYGWWQRDAGVRESEGMILVVLGMRFESVAKRDAFIELSGDHAAYCREHEPDTLIYSGGIASADADREIDLKAGDLVFVMGCTDMAAVEKHRDDPHHVALGEKFAAAGVSMEMPFHRVYRSTGRGFLWDGRT